jgi:hypothetical protein
MQLLGIVEAWLISHPLWLAFFTLIGGGLISVFSADIRQFCSIQPQKLNVWVLKTRLRTAARNLERSMQLHDEPGTLLVYLGHSVARISMGMLMMVGIGLLELLWHARGYTWSKAEHRTNIVFIMLGITICFDVVRKMTIQMSNLAHYDDYVMTIQSRIASLQKRLGIDE